jgi:hypothetical protein
MGNPAQQSTRWTRCNERRVPGAQEGCGPLAAPLLSWEIIPKSDPKYWGSALIRRCSIPWVRLVPGVGGRVRT